MKNYIVAEQHTLEDSGQLASARRSKGFQYRNEKKCVYQIEYTVWDNEQQINVTLRTETKNVKGYTRYPNHSRHILPSNWELAT